MKSDRLAAVLRVRRLQEQRARGHLAVGNLALRHAGAVEQAGRDELTARSVQMQAVSSIPELLTEHQKVESGLLALATRRELTDRAAQTSRELTAAWAVTAQRVDALERLDERLKEIERAEADRVERAEADDLAAQRHRRNQADADQPTESIASSEHRSSR